MPQGKHREDYRRKRTGEKRAVRQPTAIEKLPGELRDKVRAFVDAARDGRCVCRPKEAEHRHSWDGLAEAANRVFALQLSAMAYLRDYDLYVEQKRSEEQKRHEARLRVAEFFAARGIKNLQESVLNALAGEFHAAAEAKSDEERKAAHLNFGVVLAKFITAQTGAQRLEIERGKLKLAEQRLEQMRRKIAGAKEIVAGKKKVSPAEMQKVLDEIYGLTQ